MRILFILTYYRPHVSGLTIYVERLAKALGERGHEVTVLTSRYDRGLPREGTGRRAAYRAGARHVPFQQRRLHAVVSPGSMAGDCAA